MPLRSSLKCCSILCSDLTVELFPIFLAVDSNTTKGTKTLKEKSKKKTP